MEEEQLLKLIEKQLAGEASDEEVRLLDNWYNQFDSNPSLTSSLSSKELESLSKKMFLNISEAVNTAPDLDLLKANSHNNQAY